MNEKSGMTNVERSVRVRDAAARLHEAALSGVPCAPVRDILGTDVALAYAVQQIGTGRRVETGGRIAGRKIGMTSRAVQAHFGVDQPDFGMLFHDMAVAESDTVPMNRLLQPRVEAEIAFVLGKDLDGKVTLRAVREAIAYAVPALEIADSRVAKWDISLADTVADNASSGMFVLGSRRVALDRFDPGEVEMIMTRNGDTVSTGNGSACLGDPLHAMLWLAKTVAGLGDPLRAGQVVLSGALGPIVPVGDGDRVTASLSGLGEVSAHFATH